MSTFKKLLLLLVVALNCGVPLRAQQVIAAPPTYSLAGGSYTGSVSIALSSSTSGALIFYTTDGSTPSLVSTRYTGPIALSATTTIKAFAVVAPVQSFNNNTDTRRVSNGPGWKICAPAGQPPGPNYPDGVSGGCGGVGAIEPTYLAILNNRTPTPGSHTTALQYTQKTITGSSFTDTLVIHNNDPLCKYCKHMMSSFYLYPVDSGVLSHYEMDLQHFNPSTGWNFTNGTQCNGSTGTWQHADQKASWINFVYPAGDPSVGQTVKCTSGPWTLPHNAWTHLQFEGSHDPSDRSCTDTHDGNIPAPCQHYERICMNGACLNWQNIETAARTNGFGEGLSNQFQQDSSGRGATSSSPVVNTEYIDSNTVLGTYDFSSIVTSTYTFAGGGGGGAGGTSTSLAASTTTPAAGDAVTLTATLTGSSPSGSVTFQDNGSPVASSSLASKVATYTFNIADGTHVYTAVYSGDATNASSTSSSLTITVGTQPCPTPAAATTVTLSASTTTLNVGDPLTLTGTVSPTSTGTVTFLDGSSSIGTCILNGAFCAYTIPSIDSGTHIYTANYLGTSSSALTITPSGSQQQAILERQVKSLVNDLASRALITSVQQQSYVYALDTGAPNSYVIQQTPAATFVAGSAAVVRIANANTGPSTLNGATIYKWGAQPLIGGDLSAGGVAFFVFDGTSWQLLNPLSSGGVDATGSTGMWYQQIPVGNLDGSNTDFYLDYLPSSPYIILTENGVTQDPYTRFSLTTNHIHMAIPPRSTDEFVVWYFAGELAPSHGGAPDPTQGGTGLTGTPTGSATLNLWAAYPANAGNCGAYGAIGSSLDSGSTWNNPVGYPGIATGIAPGSAEQLFTGTFTGPTDLTTFQMRASIEGTLSCLGGATDALQMYDITVTINNTDGSTQTIRPTAYTVIPGTFGSSADVSNPARIYDYPESSPPSTYGTLKRAFFNGTSVSTYLIFTNWQ